MSLIPELLQLLLNSHIFLQKQQNNNNKKYCFLKNSIWYLEQKQPIRNKFFKRIWHWILLSIATQLITSFDVPLSSAYMYKYLSSTLCTWCRCCKPKLVVCWINIVEIITYNNTLVGEFWLKCFILASTLGRGDHSV